MGKEELTMSSEHRVALSKLNDFEISKLIIERDCANYRKEQFDELLNKIGDAKGYSDADKTESIINNESGQLPGPDFDEFYWKSYKTKQAAGPDEAAWIFSNT